MRIFVHDFGGYPFPVGLSRALARRGHTVRHVYCASLPTTPNDRLRVYPDDPDTFAIEPVELDEPLQKFSFVKRWRQERAYGRLAAERLMAFAPDVVLSANTPLDAQRTLLQASRRADARFVFWLQDLIGVAADRLLRDRIPVAGAAVGRYYLGLERRLLRRSDDVVAITDDFRPLLEAWGVPEDRTHVVENWAPLAELPVRPKTNAWARAQGLADTRCLLYTGTLGMKHNPDLLLRLALHVRDRPDVRVVVVSEGLGAEWLRARKAEHGLDNLVLLPFQPYDAVPDVMGAADVLLAILEPEAGTFSVPSKVLAYLCAGRPLLLAVPPENLAARTVLREHAGHVVSPHDADAFIAAADVLLADATARTAHGAAARAYAEATFDLATVTDAFEQVIRRAAGRSG